MERDSFEFACLAATPLVGELRREAREGGGLWNKGAEQEDETAPVLKFSWGRMWRGPDSTSVDQGRGRWRDEQNPSKTSFMLGQLSCLGSLIEPRPKPSRKTRNDCSEGQAVRDDALPHRGNLCLVSKVPIPLCTDNARGYVK